MYNTVFLDTKKGLTENEILNFEKKHNIIMPEEVKKHYLMYNGGYPEKSVFVLEDDERKYIVNYFFSIECGEGLALEKFLPLLDDENIFPKWLVPFADDEGGNLFCYSIKDSDNGAVYFYDHEFEYGENVEDHIVFLSSSLVDFINSLVEDEEDDE